MNEDISSKDLVNGVSVINNADGNTNNIDASSSSIVINSDNSSNSTINVGASENQNVSMPDADNSEKVQNVVFEDVNVGSQVSASNSVDSINNSMIQEVSFPDVEEINKDSTIVSVNTTNNDVVDSETVIGTDVNVSVEEVKEEILTGSIQEVSVNADSVAFNMLSETEVSPNSVFNKSEEIPKISGGMKEGQENNVEQKGFPIFMIIVFVILIIGAFFIDKIVLFANNIFNKEEIVEQSSKKDDDVEEEKNENDKNDEKNQVDFSKLTLNDLDKQMKKEISEHSSSNYDVSTVVEKNKYIINFVGKGEELSDYKLVVELDYKDGVLSSSISVNTSDIDIWNWHYCMGYVVRSVATMHGYSGEELKNGVGLLGSVELSLEEDGIRFIDVEGDLLLFAVTLNKKIKLPTLDNAPLLVENFERYSSEIQGDVYTTGVSYIKANMYFQYAPDSEFYFYEKGKSTKNNTYVSIINFLKFYYGKDLSSEYPELKDGIVYDFIIDVDSNDERVKEGYSLVKLTKK